ncbi:MAG TPA: hypothetical protein VH595_19605, partial [Verrucomicrobiae bacterium]|nr:hypothetical protein [Verrucomicrobiae bacterium]
MTTHKLTLPSPVKSLCCNFLLSIAALTCGTSYLAAQDITPPPAPPGQTNIVYWDANAWKVGMQPDGSVPENDDREFSPDDSGPPSPGGSGSGEEGTGSDVTYNLLEPGTNLWLLISQLSANEVQITL